MDNKIKGLFPITQAAAACGLVPAALPRGIAIVAPYTGQEIDPGKFCSRIVMPVAEN